MILVSTIFMPHIFVPWMPANWIATQTHPHHNLRHGQPTTFPRRLRHNLATQPPFPGASTRGPPWQTKTGPFVLCKHCVVSDHAHSRSITICLNGQLSGTSLACISRLFSIFIQLGDARCMVFLEDYFMASKLPMDCHFPRLRNTWFHRRTVAWVFEHCNNSVGRGVPWCPHKISEIDR